MASTWIGDIIISIDNTGFFKYALPFLLVFTIVYALLHKTKILGENNTRLNPTLALIIALLVLPFIATTNYTGFLSKFVLIFIAFITLAVVLGLLGVKYNDHKQTFMIIALILIAFIAVTEFFNLSILAFLAPYRTEFGYAALVIIIFGILIWFVTRVSKEETVTPAKPKPAAPAKPQPRQQVPAGQRQPEQQPQLRVTPELKEELDKIGGRVTPELAQAIMQSGGRKTEEIAAMIDGIKEELRNRGIE